MIYSQPELSFWQPFMQRHYLVIPFCPRDPVTLTMHGQRETTLAQWELFTFDDIDAHVASRVKARMDGSDEHSISR